MQQGLTDITFRVGISNSWPKQSEVLTFSSGQNDLIDEEWRGTHTFRIITKPFKRKYLQLQTGLR